MPLPAPNHPPQPLDLRQIQEYIWARYVDHERPGEALDEDEALAFLESYYTTHDMNTDAQCFYYGILAFERSFASRARQRPLLRRALAAFSAYHHQQTTQGFSWEVVEDRYEETLRGLQLSTEAGH